MRIILILVLAFFVEEIHVKGICGDAGLIFVERRPKDMKKIYCVLLFLLLGCMVLAGCNGGMTEEEKCSVVCTNFSSYDWTREVLKGLESDVEITYLFDDGADVHSFQPGTEDYILIAESDVFIYAGNGTESWIEEALASNPDENRIVLNLSETEGVNCLPAGEVHVHEEGTADAHEEAIDEHIWLSLRNAIFCTEAIAECMVTAMPAWKAQIESNCQSYVAELRELDQAYQEMVQQSVNPYMIVADRFPFRYLVQDYEIEYDAAFTGCQTEAEVDFDIVIELAGKADERQVSYLVITEVGNEELALTIRENTASGNQEIRVMDSMQAVTKEMVAAGKTYLQSMQDNLTVLQEILAKPE